MLAVSLLELLSLPVIQRSGLGLVVAGCFLPIVGVLIIGFDILTVRFAVMHVALLGLAVGLWVGIDPTLLALVMCAVAGMAIAPLAGRPGGLSGPMGLLMTDHGRSCAAGPVDLGGQRERRLHPAVGVDPGDPPADLALLIVLCVGVLTWFVTRRRSIGLLLFDREVAACSGVAVGTLTAVALFGVSVSIAASIRLTGALLIDSLTILPALAARNLAQSLTAMAWTAVGIGLVGNVAGFLLALALDLPPGPVLVMVAGVITISTYLMKGSPQHAPQLH